MKSVMGNVTTTYVGNYFEWTGNASTMVKYYYAGGQRIAMRTGSAAPVFLLGDHLGSTSKTYNTANGVTTEQRYTPWGGTRYGSSPTSFQYTGQRKDATGLYFYNARYYDPYLNRFLSPDTLVPDPTNPQSLNRYSYVNNNPLRYKDPTGHWLDTVVDIAGIVYDIYDIGANGLNWENGLALTVDVACAALPVVTGGGALVRAAAHADDVVDAAKAINRVDDVADAARAMENTGDILKAADNVDDAQDALRAAEGAQLDSLCFEAGTPVLTAEGNIPIETIQIGDLVLAANFETGFIGYYQVTEVFSHSVTSLLEIAIGNDKLRVTETHPFWVNGRGWVVAGALVSGDCVQTWAGVCEPVRSSRLVFTQTQVFNFEVAVAHTYYVGSGRWLVHNQCGHTEPTLMRSRGRIIGKQHVAPINVGQDGLSAFCKECTGAGGKDFFNGKTATEIREFAQSLGLDPSKAVVYTPQFGTGPWEYAHYSLFTDAFDANGYLLDEFADAINMFFRAKN